MNAPLQAMLVIMTGVITGALLGIAFNIKTLTDIAIKHWGLP